MRNDWFEWLKPVVKIDEIAMLLSKGIPMTQKEDKFNARAAIEIEGDFVEDFNSLSF